MTIGGQTFDVSQAGRSCLATLNPSSATVAAAGGEFSVDVPIGGGCNWTAGTSQSWISISSGGTGTGPGTIGFAVQTNTGVFSRSATISMAQALPDFAARHVQLFAVALERLNWTDGRHDERFVFTATACSWTAASNDPWLSVPSGPSFDRQRHGVQRDHEQYGEHAHRDGAVAGQIFTWTQTACNSPSPGRPFGRTPRPDQQRVRLHESTATGRPERCALDHDAGRHYRSGLLLVEVHGCAEPDPTPRSGTLTIAGRTLTVNRAPPRARSP